MSNCPAFVNSMPFAPRKIIGWFNSFSICLMRYVSEGVKQVAPTAALLLFAILYFGVMIDAGLFDPFINVLLKIVKADPVKITLGTAVLALAVALDGDGTTTYMITVTALLPLYKRLGMKPQRHKSVQRMAKCLA